MTRRQPPRPGEHAARGHVERAQVRRHGAGRWTTAAMIGHRTPTGRGRAGSTATSASDGCCSRFGTRSNSTRPGCDARAWTDPRPGQGRQRQILGAGARVPVDARGRTGGVGGAAIPLVPRRDSAWRMVHGPGPRSMWSQTTPIAAATRKTREPTIHGQRRRWRRTWAGGGVRKTASDGARTAGDSCRSTSPIVFPVRPAMAVSTSPAVVVAPSGACETVPFVPKIPAGARSGKRGRQGNVRESGAGAPGAQWAPGAVWPLLSARRARAQWRRPGPTPAARGRSRP